MPLCPTHNGTTYAAADGQLFTLYCNVDFPGADLPSAPASSLADCIAACAAYAQSEQVVGGASCVAVTYNPIDVNGNPCYLKYEIAAKGVNWDALGLEGARRLQYAIGGPVVYSAFASSSVRGEITGPTGAASAGGGGSTAAAQTATKTGSVATAHPSSITTGSKGASAAGVTAAPSATPSAATSMSVGMSTGAKVGVGVGVAVAIILAVLVAGWYVRQRRKRKPAFTYVQRAPDDDGARRQRVAELPGHSARHEMPGDKPEENSDVVGPAS